MRTINARNVNDAWQLAISLIDHVGVPENSRNGPVRAAPYPIYTVYSNPTERVLLDPVRDANPIFHLHEALWMLAGYNDATWLDQFVSDFSERYAESDGRMHGAYGYRWREHFENISSPSGGGMDQLDMCVEILTKDPTSRQAVIQMWDAEVDLGFMKLKDRPCNTQIYLRVREGVLDLGTMVRSNDIVWGCYGANVVHFTVLQEYLAARIGIPVGRFSQYSWNWHMYDNTRHLADQKSADSWRGYPGTSPLVTNPKTIDDEIAAYVDNPASALDAKNVFLNDTALPMFKANVSRKKGDHEAALRWAERIQAPDWKQATVAWLKRRKK